MSKTLSGKPAMGEARRQHIHGWLQPLEDDNLWSCIHTGLGWLVAAVWGVAAVLFLIVWGGS